MFSSSGTLFDMPRECLRPALLVSLLSVWVLAGLSFYLNTYTKRRYFTLWSVAWLFYSLWLTLSFRAQLGEPSQWLLMLQSACVGLAATFMMWGAVKCLELPTSERIYGWFAGFLLVWSYLGTYQTESTYWVKVAVFAAMGVASGLTAYSFFRFARQHAFQGARLLTTGFVLWGVYLASYPWWESSDQLISSGFFISGVLQLFIAVSMIIFVLEEAKTLNQDALRQIEEHKGLTADLRTKVLTTEERYRSLFAQASEAIVITTADNLRILECNQAGQRLLGLAVGEEDAHLLTEFLRPIANGDTPPQTGAEWFAALAEHRQVTIVRQDGTSFPAEVTGAPVALDGITAYQFFLQEVTERARLEQQLRQAEKLSALGQMISGVAHELNNPLAVIKGYLDLILLRHDLGPQTRADLEKVVHESNRAAKLVSNFLSFARERAAEREPVDLNRVVQRVLELREMDLRILGAQHELHMDAGLPLTMADVTQMEQLLVNLVTNALHALADWPEKRRLVVSTACRGDLIVLRVEDSGPGIAADVLPHIFEPFFTTKQVGTGTGLGLSIAHSIVTEHGGRVYYQPSALGGAAFVIELPVVAPEGEEKDRPMTGETDLPLVETGSGARVLVLDDEPILAELLCELLTSLGHAPVACHAPLRALELIQEQSFEAVLSDFRMPLMNGREFYERVKRVQPELAARIIFITGDVINQETRAFLETIGTPHLSKPFRLDTVASVLGGVLQLEAAVG